MDNRACIQPLFFRKNVHLIDSIHVSYVISYILKVPIGGAVVKLQSSSVYSILILGLIYIQVTPNILARTYFCSLIIFVIRNAFWTNWEITNLSFCSYRAGICYTTGIYYVAMLKAFGKSYSYTAWLGSLMNAFNMLGGEYCFFYQEMTMCLFDFCNKEFSKIMSCFCFLNFIDITLLQDILSLVKNNNMRIR